MKAFKDLTGSVTALQTVQDGHILYLQFKLIFDIIQDRIGNIKVEVQ